MTSYGPIFDPQTQQELEERYRTGGKRAAVKGQREFYRWAQTPFGLGLNLDPTNIYLNAQSEVENRSKNPADPLAATIRTMPRDSAEEIKKRETERIYRVKLKAVFGQQQVARKYAAKAYEKGIPLAGAGAWTPSEEQTEAFRAREPYSLTEEQEQLRQWEAGVDPEDVYNMITQGVKSFTPVEEEYYRVFGEPPPEEMPAPRGELAQQAQDISADIGYGRKTMQEKDIKEMQFGVPRKMGYIDEAVMAPVYYLEGAGVELARQADKALATRELPNLAELLKDMHKAGKGFALDDRSANSIAAYLHGNINKAKQQATLEVLQEKLPQDLISEMSEDDIAAEAVLYKTEIDDRARGMLLAEGTGLTTVVPPEAIQFAFEMVGDPWNVVSPAGIARGIKKAASTTKIGAKAVERVEKVADIGREWFQPGGKLAPLERASVARGKDTFARQLRAEVILAGEQGEVRARKAADMAEEAKQLEASYRGDPAILDSYVKTGDPALLDDMDLVDQDIAEQLRSMDNEFNALQQQAPWVYRTVEPKQEEAKWAAEYAAGKTKEPLKYYRKEPKDSMLPAATPESPMPVVTGAETAVLPASDMPQAKPVTTPEVPLSSRLEQASKLERDRFQLHHIHESLEKRGMVFARSDLTPDGKRMLRSMLEERYPGVEFTELGSKKLEADYMMARGKKVGAPEVAERAVKQVDRPDAKTLKEIEEVLGADVEGSTILMPKAMVDYLVDARKSIPKEELPAALQAGLDYIWRPMMSVARTGITLFNPAFAARNAVDAFKTNTIAGRLRSLNPMTHIEATAAVTGALLGGEKYLKMKFPLPSGEVISLSDAIRMMREDDILRQGALRIEEGKTGKGPLGAIAKGVEFATTPQRAANKLIDDYSHGAAYLSALEGTDQASRARAAQFAAEETGKYSRYAGTKFDKSLIGRGLKDVMMFYNWNRYRIPYTMKKLAERPELAAAWVKIQNNAEQYYAPEVGQLVFAEGLQKWQQKGSMYIAPPGYQGQEQEEGDVGIMMMEHPMSTLNQIAGGAVDYFRGSQNLAAVAYYRLFLGVDPMTGDKAEEADILKEMTGQALKRPAKTLEATWKKLYSMGNFEEATSLVARYAFQNSWGFGEGVPGTLMYHHNVKQAGANPRDALDALKAGYLGEIKADKALDIIH